MVVGSRTSGDIDGTGAPCARLRPMSSAPPRTNRRLNPIERTDLAVANAVALDDRTTTARRVSAFAELGDQPPLRILCGLVVAAGIARRDPKLLRTGLRMLAAHSVATGIKSFIKDRVDRTRPAEAMSNGRYRLDKGESHESRLSSMPSGHTAGITAVARAISREYPAVTPAARAAGLAVVLAQLPSKNHYVSDLAVGSVIGTASEAAVSALLDAVGDRD